ncbi:hypothetical protein PG993_011165 [Apiospora rasikravindrae]|uniref:Uncharacterized protein n=1 Tax=Apiospora rasikravindrae TaxID=990691 RepID=A0ABR1SDG0_9PEZI
MCLLAGHLRDSRVGWDVASPRFERVDVSFGSTSPKRRELCILELGRRFFLLLGVPLDTFTRRPAYDNSQSFVLDVIDEVSRVSQSSYSPLAGLIKLLGQLAVLPEGLRLKWTVAEICILWMVIQHRH